MKRVAVWTAPASSQRTRKKVRIIGEGELLTEKDGRKETRVSIKKEREGRETLKESIEREGASVRQRWHLKIEKNTEDGGDVFKQQLFSVNQWKLKSALYQLHSSDFPTILSCCLVSPAASPWRAVRRFLNERTKTGESAWHQCTESLASSKRTMRRRFPLCSCWYHRIVWLKPRIKGLIHCFWSVVKWCTNTLSAVTALAAAPVDFTLSRKEYKLGPKMFFSWKYVQLSHLSLHRESPQRWSAWQRFNQQTWDLGNGWYQTWRLLVVGKGPQAATRGCVSA